MNAPNIVFIMADDMGYGDVGCYNGESRIPTPNIDALSADGVRFTDAHAPSAVCTPTRYGVLTGRYCWRTPLKEGVIGGYDPPLIDAGRLTLPGMLRSCGYATACIGKWHVGLDFHNSAGEVVHHEESVDFAKPVSGGPTDRGFDYAFFTAGCSTAAPPYGFIENDRFIDGEFHYYQSPVNDGPMRSGMMGKSWITRDTDLVITRKACDYIERRADEDAPFFLYLTPSAPHEPCVPDLVPELASGKSAAGARGDLVWLFDWTVGQVMQTLKRTGQAQNTLVIVTSDNGALPGDFVRDETGRRVEAGTARREFLYHTYGHASCADWRGYKAHIWEGGHRIPLVAQWPGRTPAGTVSDRLVCLTDLMATCASVAGCTAPSCQYTPETAGEDSFSFASTLLGRADSPEGADGHARDHIIHHSSFGVFSIRSGRWKAILETKSSGGWPTPRGERPQPGTPGQLYDLSQDPGEQVDLWEKRSDIVDRLSARRGATLQKDGARASGPALLASREDPSTHTAKRCLESV